MNCEKQLSYGGGWEFRRCDRKATNGKFCAVHDPDRPDKVKRRKESERKFKARVAAAVDAGEAQSLRAEVSRLRAALREIAINPHSTADPYGDMYGIGVQDGHRCAANIAAAALAHDRGVGGGDE